MYNLWIKLYSIRYCTIIFLYPIFFSLSSTPPSSLFFSLLFFYQIFIFFHLYQFLFLIHMQLLRYSLIFCQWISIWMIKWINYFNRRIRIDSLCMSDRIGVTMNHWHKKIWSIEIVRRNLNIYWNLLRKSIGICSVWLEIILVIVGGCMSKLMRILDGWANKLGNFLLIVWKLKLLFW
jgi:hypothetical protein